MSTPDRRKKPMHTETELLRNSRNNLLNFSTELLRRIDILEIEQDKLIYAAKAVIESLPNYNEEIDNLAVCIKEIKNGLS
jgi:hypothetical protein